jgi:hypothetical protein
MEKSTPELTIIEGNHSETVDAFKVKPTTGLTDGEPSKNVGGEKPSFVAGIRKILRRITIK